MTLNLTHFFTQDSSKKIKSNKKKHLTRHNKSDSNMKNSHAEHMETESFVPILKRSKNVTEYKSAKKKRLDDLMSISQTEVLSHSGTDESKELRKKLNEIEKVPAYVKVKEWFKTVEDNISPNLPLSSPSVINENLTTTTEDRHNQYNNKKPSSMIRIDYQKPVGSKNNEKQSNCVADPYEFIPSQNNFSTKKRKKRSITKKRKIPDFQCIQSFTKENNKRNLYLLSKNREEQEISTEPISLASCSRSCTEIKNENSDEIITASQKFDKLLLESNENEKTKANKVTSQLPTTELSSAQDLDCSGSFEGNIRNFRPMRNDLPTQQKVSSHYHDAEETTFGLFSSCTREETSRNCNKKSRKRVRESCFKKKRSLANHIDSEIKRTFSDIINLKSPDALELEKSMENYLKNFELRKKLNSFKKNKKKKNNGKPSYNDIFCKPTKLMSLLDELAHDNDLYANHPNNISVISPKKKADDNKEFNEVNENQEKNLVKDYKNKNTNEFANSFSKCRSSEVTLLENPEQMTQNGKTDLVGFCTQEELPEKNILKGIIENMEKELSSIDSELEFQNKKKDYNDISDSLETLSSPLQDAKQSTNFQDQRKTEKLNYYCSNKFVNTSLVSFTLMGKIKKHKHSFINFLQLGRLTPTIKRTRSSVVKLVFPIGLASFAKRQSIQNKCAVGVQTPLALFPAHKNSFPKQTSYREKKPSSTSVEIQTSQKTVSSASIQTSEIRKSSTTIQTSQEVKASVEIQTTNEHVVNAGIQTSQNENDLIENCLVQKSKKSNEIQSFGTSLGVEVQKFEDSFCIENKSARNVSDNNKSALLTTKEILNISDKTSGVEYSENSILSMKSFEVKNSPECQNSSTQNFAPLLSNNQVIQSKTAEDELLKSSSDLIPTDFPCFLEHIEKNKRTVITPNNTATSSFSCVKNFETGRKCDNSSARCFQMNRMHASKVKIIHQKEECVNIENLKQESEDSLLNSSNRIFSSPKPNNRKMISSVKSESSKEIIKEDETSQLNRVQIKDISQNNEVEEVDLETEENSEDSGLQMLRVLKNIDLDLVKTKKNNKENIEVYKNLQSKVDNSEESDSDFFVEQTPPRPEYSLIDESRHSKPRAESSARNKVAQKTDENFTRGSAVDSLQKTFRESESFLVLSAPQGDILALKKSPKKIENSVENIFAEFQLEKKSENKPQEFFNEESYSSIVNPLQLFEKKTNENDQNQLNASDENRTKTKNAEIKSMPQSVAEARKRFNEKPRKKPNTQVKKRFCIVASSVKNLELIKKFTMEFQMEYSSKPTKDMTHLIVGLHENDEGEILPLCTPKLLFAMANKKWVVSELWAEACLKSKTILPEDNFETCDPIGGSGCRNSRLSTDQLLKNCEICLFGNFQNILKEELAVSILVPTGSLGD